MGRQKMQLSNMKDQLNLSNDGWPLLTCLSDKHSSDVLDYSAPSGKINPYVLAH